MAAAVSAPVFAQVAQQVLEYLGVPHDQPLKSKKDLLMAAAAAQHDVFDSAPDESGADLNAMFADVNELPADDPLRALPVNVAAVVAENDFGQAVPAAKPAQPSTISDKVLKAFLSKGGASAMPDSGPDQTAVLVAPKLVPVAQVRANGGVVVDSGERVAVPSFEGSSLRTVVERAAQTGLRVQPVGSGLAKEQAPKPGTMVPRERKLWFGL